MSHSEPTLQEQLVQILDQYRKDCYLAREGMSSENKTHKDSAVNVQALSNITTRDAITALIEKAERKARRKTLTDITIWANQEMANDHIKELKEK